MAEVRKLKALKNHDDYIMHRLNSCRDYFQYYYNIDPDNYFIQNALTFLDAAIWNYNEVADWPENLFPEMRTQDDYFRVWCPSCNSEEDDIGGE